MSFSSCRGKYWYSHWLGQNSNDKDQEDGNDEIDKDDVDSDDEKAGDEDDSEVLLHKGIKYYNDFIERPLKCIERRQYIVPFHTIAERNLMIKFWDTSISDHDILKKQKLKSVYTWNDFFDSKKPVQSFGLYSKP
jgi:hypothetical protein